MILWSLELSGKTYGRFYWSELALITSLQVYSRVLKRQNGGPKPVKPKGKPQKPEPSSKTCAAKKVNDKVPDIVPQPTSNETSNKLPDNDAATKNPEPLFGNRFHPCPTEYLEKWKTNQSAMPEKQHIAASMVQSITSPHHSNDTPNIPDSTLNEWLGDCICVAEVRHNLAATEPYINFIAMPHILDRRSININALL